MPRAPVPPLLRAAHPVQALVTAAGLAGAAAVAGRAPREVALVAATVLVGQAVLGWLDDLGDRTHDARHHPSRPLPAGTLESDAVRFAVACGVLLVVPLAVAHGRSAALAYLVSLVVAALGDRMLHARVLSFVPWAVGFALYPAFVAYGGWGGVGTSSPPTALTTALTAALAAALGVAVHVLLALPDLDHDREEGDRSLPLLLARRVATPRLRLATAVVTALLVVALLIAGQTVGPG